MKRSNFSMLLFGGGGDAAGQMRQDQTNSQAQINEGLKRINAIFGGGTVEPYNKATTYDPTQQYYTIDAAGNYVPWINPTSQQSRPAEIPARTQGGRWPFAGKARTQATPSPVQDATPDLSNLYTKGAAQTYQGFGPEFYQQRQSAFEQNAMPQLLSQFRNMGNQVTTRMAGQGLLQSSAARGLQRGLAQERGLQAQNIGNAALGSVQDLQGQVASQKSNLVSQLIASQNPAQSSQDALAAATRFSAPSPMPQIGNLFSNWANMYMANSLNNTYNQNNNNLWNSGTGGSMNNPLLGQPTGNKNTGGIIGG